MSPPLKLQKSRRSPTPATIAITAFLVLALVRMLVFRPEAASDSNTWQAVTVRHVIDGDTFDLTDGRRIRMLGIDAPEAGFAGKPEEYFSAESTAWLRDRIEGRRMQLRTEDEEKDRYGRTLAWVFDSDRILVNQEMLAAGQAKLLPDFGLPLDLEPSLREAESKARLLKLGIWKSPRQNRK